MNNIALKLQSIGIPAHVLGYEYLKSALSICLDNPRAIFSMTAGIYPAIAETHGTTPSKVERGIRHAIEICWARCDKNTLTSVFGPVVGAREKRPANAEFIAALAEHLRMEESA
ncbi:sporulation initiation factor Spo0A C-terminal domain-containing protein [Clostridium minihomine]|uniref:sporulation initiation factor Spo0A C-terminal domain-containing protein n=1 Tax=Clostridium minihomine TaxID=2045012 RepID=UPI000C78A65C|nr:sporulation initiation factor Spo0A C-terminal domain-containing protein [Clostridium minihomine]